MTPRWMTGLTALAMTGLAALATSAPARALAEDGHGEHGGHGDFHLVDMAPSFVNFIVLLVVFVWLFRDGVAGFLKGRKVDTQKALQEAAELKAAAEAKQAEYQKRLAGLDAELEDMKKKVVEAGEAERDRIIAEAERRAVRMREEAEFLVEQRSKQLRIEITREAVGAAIDAAQQLLQKATTEADQKRLADEYLEQLRKDASEGKPAAAAPPARQESRA